jgi:predicted alpha/beta-hydrolase family hydrolase
MKQKRQRGQKSSGRVAGRQSGSGPSSQPSELFATPIVIAVPDIGTVSGLLSIPANANTLFVMAHGAGAGMTHPFMEHVAVQLALRRVATLRYNFPYMERGRGRPDVPRVATATVRAAVGTARMEAPGLPCVAGGKSFGGRMTSTAQAELPLDGVIGLAFLGFPLHRPGVPGTDRAEHLGRVRVPMLFLQGTRDALADLDAITSVRESLGVNSSLHLVDGGDHSFKVPKPSGRTYEDLMTELAQVIADWAHQL